MILFDKLANLPLITKKLKADKFNNWNYIQKLLVKSDKDLEIEERKELGSSYMN